MAEDFFHKVYEVVKQIPEGKVTTYGGIAAALGAPRAARQVGWVMGRAPEKLYLPCHRVVNAKGCLSEDAFGGMQRKMLELEGVPFKPNGCVDLPKCLWISSG